ncbi:MAG TPA: hypothetical protein VLY83_03540 [Methanoregula sp.]|nr:hypothetical protein [Methanoregula sp.]
MKSPVKPRLMRIFLDGELHPEIDLATCVGFTKVATIRKAIDSFQAARFIERRRSESSEGYECRILITRENALKIYHYPEFHALRPEIRKAPWFCPLFTQPFASLPDELPVVIDQMVRASHTFFETICQYDTPEKIRETYRPALIVNTLAGVADPVFDDLCIYYQIFLHAVIRDIRYGGLGEGFAQLLDSTQKILGHKYSTSFSSTKKKAGLSRIR